MTKLETLERENEQLKLERLMLLATLYAEVPKFVATICDTKLDRSGALLGEVRKLSRQALNQEEGE